MRVYLVSLSLLGNSEYHQEKTKGEVRGENRLPGQLWSLAIDTSTSRTVKISLLFDAFPFTGAALPQLVL